MTDFGDYDPDDAWDATDRVVEQLRQLGTRIAWLIDHRDDLDARISRIVTDIHQVRVRVMNGDL